MWWVAMLGILAVLVVLVTTLLCFFGPGHEDASERAAAAPRPAELALQAVYKHDASFFVQQPNTVRIFTQYYYPHKAIRPPKAVVLYVHGLFGHSGCMTTMFEDMLRRGYVVGALDLRGHGRSSGRFGYIQDFSDSVDDILAFVKATRAKFPTRKLFLVGLSMGGLLVMHTLLRARPGLIDGSVLHAPPVMLADGVRPPAPVESIFKFLVQYVPKLPLVASPTLRTNSKSVEAQVQHERDADPLIYQGPVALGTACAILQATLTIQDEYHKIDAPFMLVHGELDRVCAIEGSERFMDVVRSEDKVFVRYPRGEHSLLEEPESFRRPFLNDIAKWIDAHADETQSVVYI
ncbi:Aste57867_16777 [Aphanomyces stellatus]|uniref:Aste57867_16777 protein n=1 Tax=Aphanomyces stellatus TaxID=120398 RepID=A0A485L838_9STRA|nr:hypothetical protein As57867_016720 [Aphanomyces stellatus]VFT93542.1 Aste57867_16777 [Aphanomyces stellatus]